MHSIGMRKAFLVPSKKSHNTGKQDEVKINRANIYSSSAVITDGQQTFKVILN